MKFFHRLTALAALAALTLSSCIKDPVTNNPCPPDPNQTDNLMTFVIRVPQSSAPTRAITEGGADDNNVQAITVLLFAHTDDGTGAYMGYADATLPDEASTTAAKTFSVVLPEGEYDLLIAANATQILTDFGVYDTDRADDLAAMTQQDFERGMTLTLAEKTAWNAKPGSAGYVPFPMAGHYHLSTERDPEKSYGPVSLLRMLAKINVTMNAINDKGDVVPSLQNVNLQEIMLCNYNRTGTLVGTDWATTDPSESPSAPSVFDLTPDLPATPDFAAGVENALDFQNASEANATTEPISVTGSDPNFSWACRDEIFIPEVAAPADDSDWKDATCLLIKLYLPSLGEDRWFRVNFRIPPTAGAEAETVNLMRNFRYTVNIEAVTANGFATAAEAYNSMPEGMSTTITAIDDSNLKDITYDGRNQLAVNNGLFVFTADGKGQDLDIYSDYDASYQWTIDDATAEWFSLSPTSGAGGTQVAATLSCDGYNGSTVRYGSFVIQIGALRKTITVIQVPPLSKITSDATPPTDFHPYVGAFWRANQTGERILNMPRPWDGTGDGAWVAVVLEGKDWIQLDTEPSSDGALFSDSPDSYETNPNFDADHQVVSGKTWAVDTLNSAFAQKENLYFRIGLNTQFASTIQNPARYGMVLLAYSNYTKLQRIWIRQGEEADYIFRPTDPISKGPLAGVETRKAAVPFSPYNLTAKTLNAPVSINGATDDATLPPAVFTQYPTQVGAYWQWSSTDRARYAWDTHSATVSDWTSDYEGEVWANISATQESCPEGYRRPSDGPIDQFTANDGDVTYWGAEFFPESEVRTSLFDTPNASNYDPYYGNANYVTGYYADGYFDRRTVVWDSEGSELMRVANGTDEVADEGELFYNSTTLASVFFPKVEHRGNYYPNSGSGDWTYTDDPYGTLVHNPGTDDRYYWTSTAQQANVAWSFVGYPFLQNACAIRCVRDPNTIPPEPPTVPPGQIPDNPPENLIPYAGAFWRDNQTGERLIRIMGAYDSGGDRNTDADGKWTAQVLDDNDGKSWITLDARMTTDTQVGWITGSTSSKPDDANSPDFEANPDRQVTEGNWFVRGTLDASHPIYFRIGLKSRNPHPGRPRYGCVLLTYKQTDAGQCSQRIWIRQGEDADYLYGPNDGRTGAAKWLPYNLTALGGMMDQPQPVINQATGVTDCFVDYPSQAGAFWQWGVDNAHTPRFARNPYSPTPTAYGSVSWSGQTFPGLWDAIKSSNETCPKGYHRPTAGPTDAYWTDNAGTPADHEQSEMMQSLFTDPAASLNASQNIPAQTMSVGYYADGFFDRQLITTGPDMAVYMDPSKNVAVAKGTNDIAYIGMLFYNPATDASLFFPCAGYLGAGTGNLGVPGLYGRYQSSTLHDSSTAETKGVIKLMLYDGVTTSSNYQLSHGTISLETGTWFMDGASIRCVSDSK